MGREGGLPSWDQRPDELARPAHSFARSLTLSRSFPRECAGQLCWTPPRLPLTAAARLTEAAAAVGSQSRAPQQVSRPACHLGALRLPLCSCPGPDNCPGQACWCMPSLSLEPLEKYCPLCSAGSSLTLLLSSPELFPRWLPGQQPQLHCCPPLHVTGSNPHRVLGTRSELRAVGSAEASGAVGKN